ncbi:MAG: ankyrin repeat domain-containing protein [Flavobacterium nitrogenifigens]|uniref:ankyrin repeat domain-containing protein n=1 Tax=Flavobacterium nitrogenifigens TaxID=1617283 RepID=UPI002807F1C1|nr:ankyrin repeat domain-containing protein [Flavobacterium nitrogenifigens]MDQ8013750.1 ankyrin repeat domain-containing protein [Flavobacterium nitrogenifigens]
MKNILLLLVTIIMSAHSCQSVWASKKNEMMQKDIVQLVHQNDISGVVKALENGANVNTIDNAKRSLLLIATMGKQIEMAKVLIKYKADVNQQAENKDSAFLYAGASGQTELVQLFLNNGARFDIFNRYNGSALIPACERGHVETVRLLANTKNFPIDHVNRLGWTALMEAIVLGDGSIKYQQIVQILKDAGSRMDIPDHDGITPLHHAQAKGFKEIVAIIKS